MWFRHFHEFVLLRFNQKKLICVLTKHTLIFFATINFLWFCSILAVRNSSGQPKKSTKPSTSVTRSNAGAKWLELNYLHY